MINWIGLAVSALWIGGLASLLAAFSYALYLGAETGNGLRAQLNQPWFNLASSLALMVFCLGLAASSTRGWWETLLWLALAIAFATQAWSSNRRRQGLNSDIRPILRAWLRTDAPLAVGLILLGMVLAILYALVIRPYMQPDEPRHFEVVQHAARLDKLIVDWNDLVLEWEQEIIEDMETQDFWWYGYSIIGWDPENLPESFVDIWGAQYSRAFFQQPLYYTLAGALQAQWQDLPLSQATLRLRLFGVFLLGLSLWGIYLCGRELFPQRPRIALAALALAALWPSHLVANATVNNDPLVEVFVIWALYFALRLAHRGPGLGSLSMLLLLSAFAVLAKRSGLVVLVLALSLPVWVVGRMSGRWTWWRTLAAVATVLLAAAAVVALFIAAQRTGRLWIPSSFFSALLDGTYTQAVAEAPLLKFAAAIIHTAIGWFGWMRVPLPSGLYVLGYIVLGLGVVGFFVGAIQLFRRGLSAWQKGAMAMLLALALAMLVLAMGKDIIYGFWRDGTIPQARYLYPALPALLLPAVLGWGWLIPQRWRRYLLPIVILSLLLFNTYVLIFVLYPFFWL